MLGRYAWLGRAVFRGGASFASSRWWPPCWRRRCLSALRRQFRRSGFGTVTRTSPTGAGPVKHATPAGPFPNPTTITSYDPVTGAFSGIDNAWDVGKEVINGVLHGNSVTYTIVDPGVVLHGQGTVTFYSDGTATWVGTWSNSIGQFGTDYGTLKGFLLAGMVQALSCGEDSCSPPTGLAGQPVLVQGTSSDGSAVSVSATSDADGTWSVGVPNGSYDVARPRRQDGRHTELRPRETPRDGGQQGHIGHRLHGLPGERRRHRARS